MSVTVNEWMLKYEAIVLNRLAVGEIKLKTWGDYKRLIRFCSATWVEKPLNALSISEITAEIKQKADTAPFAARRLRINLSNLFLEAQREGEIPPGHNPALLSRPLVTTVKTERLLFNEWLLIFKAASYCAPDYFQRAMLLAIVTGQRRADIGKMHSSHVRDGYLHIDQQKTAERIALPLTLRLASLGCTLGEVVDMCPSNGWLIQHKGKPVHLWSLTRWFQKCRDSAGIEADVGKMPPSFREQRSLSERLYREQGVDTRTLLGHKYQQMTDGYNDIRGKDYRRLKI